MALRNAKTRSEAADVCGIANTILAAARPCWHLDALDLPEVQHAFSECIYILFVEIGCSLGQHHVLLWMLVGDVSG